MSRESKSYGYKGKKDYKNNMEAVNRHISFPEELLRAIHELTTIGHYELISRIMQPSTPDFKTLHDDGLMDAVPVGIVDVLQKYLPPPKAERFGHGHQPDQHGHGGSATKQRKVDKGGGTTTMATEMGTPHDDVSPVRTRKVSPHRASDRVEYLTTRQAKGQGNGDRPGGRIGDGKDKTDRYQPPPQDFTAQYSLDKDGLGDVVEPKENEKRVCMRGEHCRSCKNKKPCNLMGPPQACPRCFRTGFCSVLLKIANGVQLNPCPLAHMVRCVEDGPGGRVVLRYVTKPDTPLPTVGLTQAEAYRQEDNRFIERKVQDRNRDHLRSLHKASSMQSKAMGVVSRPSKDDTPNDVVEKARDGMRFYETHKSMKADTAAVERDIREVRVGAQKREAETYADRMRKVNDMKARATAPPPVQRTD